MLRTAEEILKTKFQNADKLDWFKPIVELINLSRKEVIEECINKSQIICKDANYIGCNLKVVFVVDTDIYKLLIDELK